MSDHGAEIIELLERRVSLLRALARQFIDARGEFIAMDLDAMYSRMAGQEELCRQIGAIDARIAALRKSGVRASAETGERLHRTLGEMNDAQAEVRRLNQTHAAYLRRCGRTLDLFSKFFGSRALTYAPALRRPPAAVGGSR